MSEPQAHARHALHWLPNALTVSRILLIPVLVWAMLGMQEAMRDQDTSLQSNFALAALGIFIYSMASDFFDGYFARKFQLSSDFGRMLDPIADKLLVAASLIVICIISQGSLFFIVPSLIIIGRDIFVSGIREHAGNSGIILSPTKLAKWKTTFEMIAIALFILTFAMDYYSPDDEVDSLQFVEYVFFSFQGTLWLAAILSAYTGFHYFRSAMKGKPTS